MSITDAVVTSTVTRDTIFPSRAGFGTAMFAALHSLWVPLVRKFTSLPAVKAAVIAGGGTTAHPVYRAAQAYFSQNPHAKELVIGKRTRAYTQVVKMTPLNLTVGYVYTFGVYLADGTIETISYTVQTGDDATDISTALAALIDPLTGVASSAGAGFFTNTSTAGVLIGYRNLPPIADLLVQNTSTDPGIDDDLDDIAAATKRTRGLISWYGFTLDHSSEAEIATAAAWADGNVCLYVARSSDGGIADSAVTTDVASDAVAASRTRMGGIFDQYATDSFLDLAWLGRVFAMQPGTATFALKTLVGVTYSNLEDEESANIRAKKWSTYERGNGISITYEGATPKGEFLDLVWSTDLVNARVSEDVYGFLAQNQIVTYDQAGIDSVLMVAQTTLNRMTKAPNPIFSTDLENGVSLAPKVEPILIEDTTAADRSTRRLSSITWNGRFKGAIHGADIAGTIGV